MNRGAEPAIPPAMLLADQDLLPMAHTRVVSHCCAMVYGAVWAEASRPHQLYAGRLSVTPEGIVLDGPSSSRTIPPDELRAIHRGPGPGRVSGRGWLHLDFSRDSRLILTTVLGAATVSEIYDLVNGLL